MGFHFSDFIGTFENVVPDDLCKKLIAQFHHAKNLGLVHDRQQSEKIAKVLKDDETYFAHEEMEPSAMIVNGQLIWQLNQVLHQCLDQYMAEYEPLKESNLVFKQHRIQRTKAGAGYHVFHHERTVAQSCEREIAALVYLNDEFEGGETEFLFCKKRVKPKKGSVVLFPAGFTHTHRGLMVLEGEKFAVATWGVVTR